MTKEKAIEKGYTHEGLVFDDIPVYVSDDGESLSYEAKTWYWQLLLDVYLFFDELLQTDKQFYCWIGEEIKIDAKK